MNKNVIMWLIALAVIALGVYWIVEMSKSGQMAFLTATSSPAGTLNATKPVPTKTTTTITSAPLGKDFRNATYSIDGIPFTFVNGVAVTSEAPGSATKVITQVFGNEATGDLNGDGLPDIAFLFTQTSGGSGTFYYVAVALKKLNGYKGTNAVFIGDRIAPRYVNIGAGEVIVNYTDRAPGQPMTAIPSEDRSKYLQISNGTLVTI
jgi:hypothetical protein